jgi:hypothetical protein
MTSTVRAPAAPVRSRIYEKLIWDTLRSGRYDSFAELVAEVKIRCARLRVPYRDHEIDDALAAMGDKVTRELGPAAGEATERQATSTPPPLTKAEAAAAIANLLVRLGVTNSPCGPKVVPAVPVVSARQADRARAFALVVQGIRAQTAVCRALEQQESDSKTGPGC